ncbi:MAG: hypothetical protein KDB03_15545 [Planctomycetales bacterium]|nr:hypothetical protein [Planctomycetales bacterium]
MTPSIHESRFFFLACQNGAEAYLRQELLVEGGVLRLAFSRPGLLTIKILDDSQHGWEPHFQKLAEHWLVRRAGVGLGHLRFSTAEQLTAECLALGGVDWHSIHVFQRDTALPGTDGFEPGPNPLTQAVEERIRKKLSELGKLTPVGQVAPMGGQVLDVVLVEPNQWLVGFHPVTNSHQSIPGGVYEVSTPPEIVSRAYVKLGEALMWSNLPLQIGDNVVEIGSAPGGSCQRLLDMGMTVTGIDPAEMDPRLKQHPRFQHWRGKSSSIKRKQYSRFKWLTADANVAPKYTLDAIEDIVTYPTSNFSGLLLTLKLTQTSLYQQIPEYVERVRSWGFDQVKVRQLASNRKECCLAALCSEKR